MARPLAVLLGLLLCQVLTPGRAFAQTDDPAVQSAASVANGVAEGWVGSAEPEGDLRPVEILQCQPALPGDEETRLVLRGILAQPEYHEGNAKLREGGWLQELLAWVDDTFRDVEFAASDPVTLVAVALLATLVLFLVTRVLWELFARRRIREGGGQTDATGEPAAHDLLEAAAQASRRGDYRSALRYRYLAVLRVLELPTLVLLTNRQLVRRLVRDCPSAHAPFAELVRRFEDAWYGGLPCAAADYREAGELAGLVELRVKEAGP